MEVSEEVLLDSRGIHLPPGVSQLLSLVASKKAVSRAELEDLAGISRSTIIQRLGVLLSANLVVEAEHVKSSGGRPTKLLKVNDDFALTISADIGESQTRVAITNLTPCILAESTFATNLERSPDSVLSEIMASAAVLLAQIGRPKSQVLGMGLSLPSPIDYENARVFGPSVMRSWDDFDIRGWLWEHFQIEVFADNDVNLIAFAEHRSFWPEEDYFFFIKAGTGIGSGIVTKGQLFRGGQGTAGDIGHMQMDYPHPPLCRCGKLGCLEAYAAGWAVARDLRVDGFEASNARDVVELVNRNVPEAIQSVRGAGRAIGEVTANVVSLLNPNLIVIGGTLARAEDHLLAGVREMVNQRCLPLATRKLKICTARSGDRAGILGAAQLVIDERLHCS